MQALRRERVGHAAEPGQREVRDRLERRRWRGPPPRSRKPAAAPIIAPLSVHQAGGGTRSGRPVRRQPLARASRAGAVGGHSAAQRHRGHAMIRRRRPPSCVASASTTASSKAAARPSTGIGSSALAVAGHLAQDGGLQPREAEVVAPIGLRPRKARRRRERPRPRPRSPVRPDTAGPSSRPTLSNASPAASSTVWPRSAVATVIVPSAPAGCARRSPPGRGAETAARRAAGLGGRASVKPVGVDVALDVVHADQRQVVGDREGLARSSRRPAGSR